MASNDTDHSDEQTHSQVIYRAVGWVAGIYQSSEEKIYQGVYLT